MQSVETYNIVEFESHGFTREDIKLETMIDFIQIYDNLSTLVENERYIINIPSLNKK